MSDTPEQLTPIALLQQVTSDYQAVQRERNELIVALSNILANPDGCSLCDSGRVRNKAKGHQPDCVYQVARDLLDQKESHAISVSKEVVCWYKSLRAEGVFALVDETAAADFLRDTLARALKAEFQRDHKLEPRAGSDFCSTLELDQRHRWIWEQWQDLAEKKLRG